MAVKRLMQLRPQYDDGNGALASGYRLFFYAAKSSTKQNTYNSSTGLNANTNPIVLNALGEPAVEVWGTVGQTYKVGLAIPGSDDPPASFIWNEDDISPINDTTVSIDQWVAGPAPTFVSATSFTLVGDQTSTFHIGRRLKSTNTAGTIYSTITNSVFGASTTVTVVNDSGTLDSGLSAVNYGLLSADNPSVPWAKAAANFAGVLSPSQITANQNDYSPASLATANVLRLSSDARRSLTGLTGGTSGRGITVHNVGTFPILFKYEDTNSSAANRFSFGCTLGGGQSMDIAYDVTSARWRGKILPEPLGTIKDFGTSTMPESYLAIDQNVSRTTYASLFNEVGTAWGTGDGSTTFGLFVGAGAALVAAGTGTQSEAVAAASVDTASDFFTVASNDAKWITGMAVVLTTTSGLPAGLSLATTYYLIRASATTIKFASSLANAQNGTAIDLTTQGTGTHTLTWTGTARTHGQRLGEETHAMSSTELLAHTHTTNAVTGVANSGGGAVIGVSGGSTATGSAGGNAAMNIMQPSAVVTRGIRYC